MSVFSRKGKKRAQPAVEQGSPGFPIELWIDILREAQYDDLVPSYGWLKKYALVCRAWRPHAQQLLFQRVALNRGASHCKAFLRAIASIQDKKHADMLTGSIQTLSMSLDHQEIYADIIEMCTNLKELRMCLYHASFRPNVLARLARVAQSIKMLHVRAYTYSVLFQTLPLFPAVEILDIDCSPAEDALPVLSFPAPAWRLRELRYTNFRRGTHVVVDWALSGAAAGSCETLEALQVQCPSFSPTSLPELGATHVRSLFVSRVTEEDDLSPLCQLQEVWMTHPRYPPPAFSPLPPSIRHITLDALEGVDYDEILADLHEFYERTGGNLASLTYHRQCIDREDPLDDIRALYEFCEEHDVEFRLVQPPYGSYPGERIPLSMQISVPRVTPLSSRRESKMEVEALLQTWYKKRSAARRFVTKAKRALNTATMIHPAALAKP
ncbi:hypothetical protein L226DRAFT_511722 [Lentinus tigrinus ALCF2SS1-7]|uniref:F-box domain-containing protein n=1 Tax=Lentinus tigrinus ALCF2SS1-6 TaxID=1328759 RepID=A0A5C2RWV8_9APHY|nr:hypothetical protein L227DRAFT_566559 [Lentinus tigrinus ALCF2SS1-6]RPD72583.1 hypothetical protein L226DRAFT_511722 [Lentinus tigrinus ALCF2SS1-7]